MRKFLLVILIALPLYFLVPIKSSYADWDPMIQIRGSITSCTPTNVSGSIVITFSNIYVSEGGAYKLPIIATKIGNWIPHIDGSNFIMHDITETGVPNGTIGDYPVTFNYNPSTFVGWSDFAHYTVSLAATARNSTYGEWYPRQYPSPNGDGQTHPFTLSCDLNPPPECSDEAAICGGGTCGANKKCNAANKCEACVPATPCTDFTAACGAGSCGTNAKCDSATSTCVVCTPPVACTDFSVGCGVGTCGSNQRCDSATSLCVTCTPPTDECTPADGVCNQGFGPPGAVYCTAVNTACMRVGTNTYNTCEPCVGASSNTYKGPIVTIKELIALIYKIMVPVSIGFGLFFIILGGYTIKTSEGDPIKKKAGMEQLTAAIIGTLFVVLSLTILQIIITSVLGGTP